MNDTTNWIPPGVDLDTLRAEAESLLVQEREIKARLDMVQRLLETLTGRKVRRATATTSGQSTRLSQILQVVEESDVPLPVRAIYERLRDLDPSLHWTNPAPVLRSYLRRQEKGSPDEIVLIERGRYGLRRKHRPRAATVAEPEGGPPQRPAGAASTPSPLRKGTILSVVYDVLSREGGPLSLEELLERLEARNVQFRASDPKDSLKVNLGKSRHFVRITSGEFDLAERYGSERAENDGEAMAEGGGRREHEMPLDEAPALG